MIRCSSTWFVLAVALGLLAGVAGPSQAGILADGNWIDWGLLTYSDTNLDYSAYGTSYPHTPGTHVAGSKPIPASDSLVYFDIEDSDDSAGLGGRVEPQYGGQMYDAEFLGVAMDEEHLYIAIFTGQRPANGVSNFGPGDIRVTAGGTDYGIEVGGGQGGDLSNDGVDLGESGTHYSLRTDGHTLAADPTALQKAGSVWKATVDITPQLSDWEEGISGTNHVPAQLKADLPSGQRSGDAKWYSYKAAFGTHAFIEVAVPLSLFGGQDVDIVGWGPACGNDYCYLEADISPPPPRVPEPASFGIWALLVAGAGGCSWWRCSRRRKRGTA
jgi:hypothetical protein